MSTFLKDAKSGVCLRQLELGDAELCAEWMNDQRNRKLLRVWLPCSLKKEKVWIKKMNNQSVPPNDIACMVVHANESVGVVGLHHIQWDWRCAEIGICIGSRTMRRSGVGTAAYKLLMSYAFEEMGLSLIESEAYSTNEPSVKFHKSVGFKQIGRTDPKALVGGKRVPIVLFSMTHKRWRKLYAGK